MITLTSKSVINTAAAQQNISAGNVNVVGIAKNLLPGTTQLTSITSFTSLSSLLTQAATALGLPMSTQLTSFLSSITSINSLVSSMPTSITSLATGLSAFTSIGTALSGISGLSGTFTQLSGTIQQVIGALGSLSQLQSVFSSLVDVSDAGVVSSLAPINAPSFTLETMTQPSASLSAISTTMPQIDSMLGLVQMYQGLGVQLSQPGSTASVLDLRRLAQIIKDLLLDIEGFQAATLNTNATTIAGIASTVSPAVASVISGIAGLP